MKRENVTSFLNVDLELVAAFDLDPLLAQVGGATITLRDSYQDSRRRVWLELAADPSDADAAIRAFADMVIGLPPGVRELWDRCEDRCLNVGIQAGVEPPSSSFRVESSTLASLAKVAARLEFTVYARTGAESPNNQCG